MYNMATAYYRSEIGVIEIAGTEEGIWSVTFVEQATEGNLSLPDHFRECIKQLDEYFQRTRKTFSLKLIPEGTEFQQQVWQELLKIPYGETVTYQDIAVALRNPNASQAVGNANAKNPIAIIIPCHRVIGNDGKLTGYAGGLWRKEWLLKHEGALII
jgi:methylated-DNA-[protein]-cysteine S-methyltransferase